MMHVSPEGRAFIEKWEGCRLTAYRPLAGDVWTIGYGNTGPGIHEGLTITKDEADAMFAGRLASEFEPAVSHACAGVTTTQGQFDAMVSLAYNIGAGAFARSSVVRHHVAGDYDAAGDAFELYDHFHGDVLESLHNRRVDEAQMYLDASPDAP